MTMPVGSRMMAVEEYLKANMARIETTNNAQRTLQENDENESYAPSFEGYLDIGFSIHVPCDLQTLLDCRLDIDDFSQSRLESLVMLFLCSEGVELVVSTAPDEVFFVCPFNDKKEVRTLPTTKVASSNPALLINLVEENAEPEPMMVWNLPRFESETIAFDNPSGEQKTIMDMATNTTFILNNGPTQQYYTKLLFTYPVYQWGSSDPVLAEAAFQEEFDSTVVSTGTLDALLPWPNAVAAAFGQEPYIFWDADLPPQPGYFDNTLPSGAIDFLRITGYSILVLNTIAVLALSICSYFKERRDAKKAKFRYYEDNSNQLHDWRNHGGRESDYLDTEAGVSAILMESKHYALAKSQAFDTERTYNITNVTNSADRNISGVEVDLKMVDHPSQLVRTQSNVSEDSHNNQSSLSQLHYDHQRSPPTMDKKEDLLLARAKIGTSTPWFSDKKLLNTKIDRKRTLGVDYDDDEDQAENEDLQLLDLVSPKSEVSSKISKVDGKNTPTVGSC